MHGDILMLFFFFVALYTVTWHSSEVTQNAHPAATVLLDVTGQK